MTIPSLPPEIWVHIASFLPTSTLETLYAVNPVLFDLVMNLKYTNVELVGGTQSRRLVELLQNDVSARRVKSLCISFDFIYSIGRGQRETGRTFLGSAVRHVRQLSGKLSSLKSLEISPGAVHTMFSRMTAVERFDLDMYSKDWTPGSYSLVNIPWKTTLGKVITELNLSAFSEDIDLILSSPTHLPFLATFSVRVLESKPQPFLPRKLSAPTAGLLASFIRNHRTTLTCLILKIRSDQYDPHLSQYNPLYSQIPQLPRLRILEVDASVSRSIRPEHRTAEMAFVQRQCETLTQLSLPAEFDAGFMTGYNFTLDSRELRFPLLTRFSASAGLLASSWGNTSSFLKDHRNTLDILAVQGPLARTEVNQLLLSINHRVEGTVLSSFSFVIYQLDAGLLDTLAIELPRLKSLDLRISKIGCSTRPAMVPSQVFPRDSAGDVYPFITDLPTHPSLTRWNLTDITIKRRSCCGQLWLWGLMAFVAENVPSITSYAGRGYKLNLDLKDGDSYELPQLGAGSLKACSSVSCTYMKDHSVQRM